MVWTTLKNPQKNIMEHLKQALIRMRLDNNIIEPFITVKESTVSFTIQHKPISEVGVNGCQLSDMIEFSKRLLEVFNELAPCEDNTHAINYLNEVLHCQEKRTMDRINRNVEGTNNL